MKSDLPVSFLWSLAEVCLLQQYPLGHLTLVSRTVVIEAINNPLKHIAAHNTLCTSRSSPCFSVWLSPRKQLDWHLDMLTGLVQRKNKVINIHSIYVWIWRRWISQAALTNVSLLFSLLKNSWYTLNIKASMSFVRMLQFEMMQKIVGFSNATLEQNVNRKKNPHKGELQLNSKSNDIRRERWWFSWGHSSGETEYLTEMNVVYNFADSSTLLPDNSSHPPLDFIFLFSGPLLDSAIKPHLTYSSVFSQLRVQRWPLCAERSLKCVFSALSW